ncbi:MAG: tRNA pseudouridine(55) synthase TruB [Xanthomonadales bacterium]|nr:tRNA pseudouridine(55) synthase TruB [Xanthomonadales bacterium]
MSRPRSTVAWRPVDGILLLDKPTGLSSNQALQRVKFLLRAEKAGHTGSLDPLATGMLPLCFGATTKVAGQLLGASKCYETVARLGIETDTLDADGQVVAESPVPGFDSARIGQVLTELTGDITQVPPAFSALKRDGVPLYRLARAGKTVEVEARRARVESIELIGHGANWIRLRIECGAGTYVRSLVRDLGDTLGCGAHVAELRRLWVQPFPAGGMHSLEQLEALEESARLALLLPVEAGLRHLPAVELGEEVAARLVNGQRIPSEAPEGECIAWSCGQAVARVRVDAQGLIHPLRILRIADPSG